MKAVLFFLNLLFIQILGGSLSSQELSREVEEFRHFEQDLFLRRSGDPQVLVSNLNRQKSRFRPDKKSKFKIKTYWVAESDFPIFSTNDLSAERKKELIQTRNGTRYIRLFVHPESERFYSSLIKDAERAEDYWAVPTASARSLIVWGPSSRGRPFIAKVSLDAVIGHSDRKIKGSEVARSLGYAQLLSQADAALPKNLVLFPEVLGGYWKGKEKGGQIIRELPEEMISGEKKYLPMFALYETSKRIKEPMLAKMISNSGLSPQEFIRKFVFKPYAKLWMESALIYGWSSEDHGQNLLMELDSNGNPTGRFAKRDFGGFFIDLPLWNRRIGGPSPANLPSMGDGYDDYFQFRRNEIYKENLRIYFVGSILHDLGVHLRRWNREGLIGGKSYSQGELEWDFLTELERAYKVLTGKPAAFYYELSTLQSHLKRGRPTCAAIAKRLKK